MLNLNDREWKEFFIGGNEGVFKITSSSSGIDKGKLLKADEANVPYVTRSDKNNGIDLFVTKQNKKVDLKNVITIGLDTQTIFYQPHAFYTGQNIQVLSNPFLNKYVAMFIIPLLKSQMVKFNWGGNGATLTRLNRTKLLLPVDYNKNPDYEFMEQYIKEQESRKREEYIQHIKNGLHNIEYKEIKKWEELEWKPFTISKLFKIEKGKGPKQKDITNGSTPYISATNTNNGLVALCNAKPLHDGNTISVSDFGMAFYQEKPYVGTHIIVLNPIFQINSYSGSFMASCITNSLFDKFSFGYAVSANRFPKEKILLPANASNEPDYEYMEQYVKNNIYLRNIQYLIERGIENSNYKTARFYTEGYGIVTSILPANNSPEDSARYVFDLKARKLLITLDFAKPDNFDFYLSNILSTEIIDAINTGAINLKFRTSTPTEMDEFSEGYDDRTNLALSYLTKYKISIPENKYDIWNKN